MVLIAIGIRMLAGPDGNERAGAYVHDSFVMGTMLNIKVRGASKELAASACEAVVDESRRLHELFDPHDEHSAVSYTHLTLPTN